MRIEGWRFVLRAAGREIGRFLCLDGGRSSSGGTVQRNFVGQRDFVLTTPEFFARAGTVDGGWLQRAALRLARELRVEAAARIAVGALAEEGSVALARVWLAEPGWLRLAASAGNPRGRGVDWSRIDGTYARIPLGTGKIGRVGASGTAVLLHDMSERSQWIADPAWAAREAIRAFAAQPLLADANVLGVLAVFRRSRLDAAAFEALRALAGHTAAAVVRARTLDEARARAMAAERECAALRAELRRRGLPDPAAAGEVPVLSIGEWRAHERANLEAALRRSGG
ncbi:MAG TPA: GAF domain-containing protein, partial [Vicinamibacterales bacterium]|nr:GAF domain-containing protein [Vicinamibacterales bacterium]